MTEARTAQISVRLHAREKELLGVWLSEHPFTRAAPHLAPHVTALCAEITPENLADLPNQGRDFVLAGIVGSSRRLNTRDGRSFIAAYIEGVKEGKRFFELAKSLLGRKPLIIWKGGLTETGKKAVNSHTGSMSGEKTVWQAFSRQTGTVLVDNFEEFLDTTALFLHFSECVRRRVAVVGGGGSVGVAASDICEQVGLQIPTSPPDIQQQLRALLPPAGTSIRNPIDVGAPMLPPSVFQKVLEILLSWDGIDALIIDRIYFYGARQLSGMSGEDSEKRVEVLLDIKKKFKKPLLAILGELTTDVGYMDIEADRRRVQDRFLQNGIAVLPSLQRAVKALSNVCSYYEKAYTLK